MARTSKPDPPFPTVAAADVGVTLILSPKPTVRSQSTNEGRAIFHYAADGELVRADLLDANEGIGRRYRPDEMYLGLARAAERIGVHPATLRRVAAKGTLRTERIGNQLLTTLAWLHEYEQNRRGPGRPRKSA